MLRVTRRWLIAAAVSTSVVTPAIFVAAQRNIPRFEKASQCPFTPGDWASTVRLECGYLIVDRVRERPADGALKIAVAIVHPLEPSNLAPIVLPHGGPSGPGGLLGGEMGTAVRLAPAMKRDVVVYDERGAGFSEPELCPYARAETPVARNLPPEQRQAAWNNGARACAAELRARGFDPSMFSTPTNAADLIDLRKALGYSSWNVWGVSYGSRIAQAVMRRDPAGVRSAVLGAPVLPGPAQELEAPLAFQHVMDRVFTACAAQPACARAFPTLAKDFDEVYEELNARPLEVVFDTQAGTSTVALDGERLVRVLHDRFARHVGRVPLFISELRRGDRMHAARALLGYASVAPGNNTLTNLVGCFESGGRAAIQALLVDVRAGLRPQFQPLVNTEEECPFWQQRFATDEDRSFVETDVPTLILTSEFDDRTPTDNGHRIAAHLKHVHVVEMPGLAHGQPHPCQQSIARSFIDDPSQPPDTSCLTDMQPLAFETKDLEPISIRVRVASDADASSVFNGDWEGAFPDAPVLYRFELTIAGRDLHGVVNAGAQAFPIFDAHADAQMLTFKTKTANGDRTITFTGRRDGDRIIFSREVAVRPGANPGGAGLWGMSGPRSFTVRKRSLALSRERRSS